MVADQVFTEAGPGGGWVHRHIKLPRALKFEDYSGISLVGDRLAVVSQASSALWVGRLRRNGANVVDEVADEGTVFRFPTDAEVGPSTVRSRACRGWETIGWSWSPTRSSPIPGNGSGRAKDQSIHIFTIPTTAEGARP